MTGAVLLTALTIGAAFATVEWLNSTADDVVEHPGPAATDEQTQAEVVTQAKAVVTIAGLAQPTADYALVSCRNRNEPPYQGAVYVNFLLPADVGADAYFRGAADALRAHGWTEGPQPNQHFFGRNLSKNGVSALLFPETSSSRHGIAQIHGQCRDTTDHQRNPIGWTDVTAQLH